MTIYHRSSAVLPTDGLGVFYDPYTLGLQTETATSFLLADNLGATIEFTGTGFVHEGNRLTDGLISSIVLRDADGTKVATFTDMAQSLADIWTAWQVQVLDNATGEMINFGPDCLKVVLMDGNDTIVGNSLWDELFGFDGRDVLRGKGGDDYFYGGLGNDRLIGGAGADGFVFSGKFGTDVVVDFHDTGPAANQDVLWVSAASHAAMVAVQTGANVDLSFGGSNHVILKDYALANLGLEDFMLF